VKSRNLISLFIFFSLVIKRSVVILLNNCARKNVRLRIHVRRDICLIKGNGKRDARDAWREMKPERDENEAARCLAKVKQQRLELWQRNVGELAVPREFPLKRIKTPESERERIQAPKSRIESAKIVISISTPVNITTGRKIFSALFFLSFLFFSFLFPFFFFLNDYKERINESAQPEVIIGNR